VKIQKLPACNSQTGEMFEMTVLPSSPQRMFNAGKNKQMDINHAKTGTSDFDEGMIKKFTGKP